jgi:hypothetical protein
VVLVVNEKKAPSGTTREFLRRYTELRYVLQLLRTRRLAFLDPNTWDDKNDSHFLMAYKEAKHFKSLMAVCFTRVSERHHHWERFATRGGGAGVDRAGGDQGDREPICIQFGKDKLLSSFSGNGYIQSGSVQYGKLVALEKHPPRMEKWLFLKRYPYRDEQEFRIIYASPTRAKSPMMLPIDLGAIDRIIIGPYADAERRDEIKAMIRAALSKRNPPTVTKTTILDNLRWKRIVDRARERAMPG